MRHGLEANPRIELINLIGVFTAVRNYTAQTDVVVFCFCANRLNDAVHRKDRVKIIGSHNQRPVSMLQWGSKATANHVTQDIKDHHIGIF